MATWMKHSKRLACLIFSTLISVFVEARENLTVTVCHVYGTNVKIDWFGSPPTVFVALATCDLFYGPVDKPEQIQVQPDVNPDRHMFELVDLSYNVSYHFHVICYNHQQIKYVSNTLTFTTGLTRSQEKGSMIVASSSQKGSMSNRMGGFRPYPVALESDQRIPSSNVILGASCGIVGFLIINITVVMVFRKYSYWRMSQRRLFALQDRQYDGFPDI